MPANLRLGQKLFFSAEQRRRAHDAGPLGGVRDAATSKGRSDAVTWLFAQGPRDTPTNAGGMLDTGFPLSDRGSLAGAGLLEDDRRRAGGRRSRPADAQQPLLDAIADYVNYALPAPVPPSPTRRTRFAGDALASLRAQGESVFDQVGCPTCHTGPAKTDSGSGNPMLTLGGPIVSSRHAGGVLLHDVGTCVTNGPWPDVVHDDIDGDPRPSCAFDTPALRGWSTRRRTCTTGARRRSRTSFPSCCRRGRARGHAARR